jgi:hypothetical protein
LLGAGVLVASALLVPAAAAGAGAAVPTVSGSMTDSNACTQTLTPPLVPPSSISVSVTAASDASPEPHDGASVRLTNSKVTTTIPGSLLQGAVDAGSLGDGFVIPTVFTFVVAGSNTTEGSHTYTANATETVHIVNGVAQPLVASATLPDTTWHPIDASAPVVVSERSLKSVSTLRFDAPINISVVQTIDCTPSTAATIVTVDGRVPSVVPGAVSVVEGNSGTHIVKIPLTLSSAYPLRVTVHWSTELVAGAPGAQADPATDYVAASGITAFNPGQTTKTVSITVNGDTTPEPDEYIPVFFSQPSNARMGGFWGIGFALISNDDGS